MSFVENLYVIEIVSYRIFGLLINVFSFGNHIKNRSIIRV